MAHVAIYEEEYRKTEVGSKQLVGEKGYSVLERTWARPTLDVHGIPGGFIGAGAKTVIPAKATAKVSMRLVPGQTPAKAFALYKSYVEKIAPAGVEVDVRLIHSGDPCVVGVDNPYIRAATRALHEVWGKDTVFIRSGGSIPIVGDFDRHLGLPSVMMGFGLPDDNLHAPNEKFNLKNFALGIESLIRFMEEARRMSRTGCGGDLGRLDPECGRICSCRWPVDADGPRQSARAIRSRPLIAHALSIVEQAGLVAAIAGAHSDLAAYAPVVRDPNQAGVHWRVFAQLWHRLRRATRFFCPSICLCCRRRWWTYLLHHAPNHRERCYDSVGRRIHPDFSGGPRQRCSSRVAVRASKREWRLLCSFSSGRGRPWPAISNVRRELLAQSGQVIHPQGLPPCDGFST